MARARSNGCRRQWGSIRRRHAATLSTRRSPGSMCRSSRTAAWSAPDRGGGVVGAHCASMGEDRDLDRGAHGPYVASFGLFARLMDDPRFEGRLFGDLSAITQINRAVPALASVVARSDWQARLLNGSDY